MLAVLALEACGSAATPSQPGASSHFVVATAPSAAGATPDAATPGSEASAMPTTAAFTLTSAAFADGAAIPREYTCQGSDDSPALSWSGVPAGTAALVLVVDDPDARDFTHWLVLDMDPALGSLGKGLLPTPGSPQQGRNDFGRIGWGGPCPPSGTHHYRFRLSAVAAPLGLGGHPDRAAVDAALAKATILGTAMLTGTYRKS